MSFGRLFVAALLVSPVASCGGSLFAVASEMSRAPDVSGYSADTVVATFVIVGIVSFVIVLAALLLVALPLTILMDRFDLPALVRDGLLIALGNGAAIAFVHSLGQTFRPAWQVGLAYGLLTSLLWIVAVRRLSPRRATAVALESLQGL